MLYLVIFVLMIDKDENVIIKKMPYINYLILIN